MKLSLTACVPSNNIHSMSRNEFHLETTQCPYFKGLDIAVQDNVVVVQVEPKDLESCHDVVDSLNGSEPEKTTVATTDPGLNSDLNQIQVELGDAEAASKFAELLGSAILR